MLFFKSAFFIASLANLPTILASPINVEPSPDDPDPSEKTWPFLDCYAEGVTLNNVTVGPPGLNYNWILTSWNCYIYGNGFKAVYNEAAGRCQSAPGQEMRGSDWWSSCQDQAAKGFRPTLNSPDIYFAKYAEGRGYYTKDGA